MLIVRPWAPVGLEEGVFPVRVNQEMRSGVFSTATRLYFLGSSSFVFRGQLPCFFSGMIPSLPAAANMSCVHGRFCEDVLLVGAAASASSGGVERAPPSMQSRTSFAFILRCLCRLGVRNRLGRLRRRTCQVGCNFPSAREDGLNYELGRVDRWACTRTASPDNGKAPSGRRCTIVGGVFPFPTPLISFPRAVT